MNDSNDLPSAGIIFTIIGLIEQERQKSDNPEVQAVLARFVNNLTLYLTPISGEC